VQVRFKVKQPRCSTPIDTVLATGGPWPEGRAPWILTRPWENLLQGQSLDAVRSDGEWVVPENSTRTVS
jgi:hypothetical protein